MVIDELYGFGEILSADARQNGSENFLLVDAHRGCHAVKQGAAGEESILVSLNSQSAAIHDNLRAFCDADADIVFDALEGLRGDNRPHFGIELHAVLDSEGFDPLGQQGK